MPGFSLSFDPQSLKQITQFAGFRALLSDEVQAAMNEAGSLLIASIQGHMHWKNPTGALFDSIQRVNDSPYEIEIGSALPYIKRREFGFSQMVDSLGRFYPYDPGAFFMLGAYNDDGAQISAMIEAAAYRAIQQLSGY